MHCACRTILRLRNVYIGSVSQRLSSAYKSQIALEKLYPESNQNFLRTTELKHTQSTDEDAEFSGYIPIDDVSIQYMRSGGSGGQNVNKVNSKVEMRFHVDTADWIPDWSKPNLKDQQRGRISKDGYLIVRSEKTRKQILNQADCLDKLRQMVFQACVKPAEPTEEKMALKEKRIARAKLENVRQKRHRALLKSQRSGHDM